MSTLPAGVFTASLLFDMLSLIADHPEQARSYQQRAADLLRLGLSSSLSSLALGTVDYLRTPQNRADSKEARKFALSGALIAIYLLDLAARQRRLVDTSARPLRDVIPVGLSLLGLTLLGISDRLK